MMVCLNCEEELPFYAMECGACGQPVYTLYGMPLASKGRRIDGCLPETPSPKDFRATANVANLPRKVDLREHCTPVENQANIGSCTACAAVGALEYRFKRAGKPHVDLSRLFVYFNARRSAGRADRDGGATISEGLAALLAFGAPPESAWPYSEDRLTKTPDPGVYDQARQNVPTEYARVEGTDGVRAALAQDHPVVFSSFLPQRCYDEAAASGNVPDPTDAELQAARSLHGNHSMLIVGYDLDAGVFLVRNSWGPGWAEKGYCRMPFGVYERVVAQSSTWILGNLEERGAFTVSRPARAAAPLEPIQGGVKDLAAKMREDIRSSLTKDIEDSIKGIKDRLR